MHIHVDQEDLILEIFTRISWENNKSLETIKRQLLIKQNQAIILRFWEMLDEMSPGHNYQYVGCCAECGALELREELPV